jgi:hypothetical protein
MANDALDCARGTWSLASAAPLAFSISGRFRYVRQVVQPIAKEAGLLLLCSDVTTARRFGQPAVLHHVLRNLDTSAIICASTGTVTATAIGETSVCFRG